MNRNKKTIITGLLVGAVVLAAAAAYAAGVESASRAPVAVEVAPATATPAISSKSAALLKEFSGAFETAAQRVNRAVVPIYSDQKVETRPFALGRNGPFGNMFGDEFFRHFFHMPFDGQGRTETLHSLGSGVIVSPDGYILTNAHVVKNADKLTVVTGDNDKHVARVIGVDPETDVAVVKIDATDLPAAVLGNSNDLKVGEWVIAIGNPLEMLHTVTAGIVSATGRSEVGIADYENYIQTDASINPGNSGGALADLDGDVVGINTAIATPTGASVGIGFAIPINMARNVMDQLIANGHISRGYLALVPQDVSDDLAAALGLQNTDGALVADVSPGGPADHAGVERGDVILKFDGHDVENANGLRNLVAAAKPGTEATLEVLRHDRKTHLTVKLGERPAQNEEQQAAGSESETGTHRLGVEVQNLTPDLARQLGYQNEHGVLVAGVESGSPADDAGLRQGDLIEKVGNTDVRSVQELRDALSGVRSGDAVALLVHRNNVDFYVGFRMP